MTELTGVALLRTVLPDEFSSMLSRISSNWRKDKFAIGDIRNSLKAMVDERLLPICAPDIDDFLSECLNHEIEPRTVRYYAMIADAFSEPMRAEYSMLSHAHFACAHTFGSKAELVLDLARDREFVSGKVPSCDWLRAAMSGYIYEKQSGEFPGSTLDAADSAFDDTPNIPQDDSELAQPSVTGWLTGLRRAVQFAINNIESAPLDAEQRGELFNKLCEVDLLLQAVVVIL
jgi:hypothetical protein